MSILTPADTEFFPELDMFGEELLAAIRTAEILAESSKGSDRPLEITEVTEKLEITSGSIYVSRLPIVQMPAPIVRVRTRSYNSFGRGIPTQPWVTLQPADYEIDYRTGEIQLMIGMSRSPMPSLNDWRSTPHGSYDEAQITYSSGFDFQADPLSKDARDIKQAVANILKAQNPQYLPGDQAMLMQGVSSFRLEGDYTINYNSDAVAIAMQNLLENSLQTLQKWQPRTYF